MGGAVPRELEAHASPPPWRLRPLTDEPRELQASAPPPTAALEVKAQAIPHRPGGQGTGGQAGRRPLLPISCHVSFAAAPPMLVTPLLLLPGDVLVVSGPGDGRAWGRRGRGHKPMPSQASSDLRLPCPGGSPPPPHSPSGPSSHAPRPSAFCSPDLVHPPMTWPPPGVRAMVCFTSSELMSNPDANRCCRVRELLGYVRFICVKNEVQFVYKKSSLFIFGKVHHVCAMFSVLLIVCCGAEPPSK